MDLKTLNTDPKKADGVWATLEDARFLIRSATSPKYLQAISRETRKHQPQKVRTDIGTQTEIAVKAAAAELLLDFEGITDNGKKLQNTQENREKLMRTPVIREFVSNFAQDISNFQEGGETADVADLKSGS